MNTIAQRLNSGINYALYFGLFVLVAGFFVRAENSKYHTLVYLGFFIPALVAVTVNARAIGRDLVHDRPLQIFTLFLTWLTITLLWAPHIDTSHILKILLMHALMVLAMRIMLCDMRLFNFTLTVSISVGAVVIGLTLFEYLTSTGSDFYRHRLGRLGERSTSAIAVGQISAFFMMFSIMQARLVTRTSSRLYFIILAIIFLLPLIFSFSRTAFMALALTAVWYIYYKGHRRAVLVLLALSLSLLVLMMADIDHELLTNISRPESMQARFLGWEAIWGLIQQSWLLGYGVGTPITLSFETATSGELQLWHAHNLFLTVWYESGLVGLVLFLALLSSIALKIRPLMHDAQVRYWTCIFVFVTLNLLVDSPPQIDRPGETWLWFWLPLAVMINADKLLTKTSPTGSQH